MSVYAEAPIKNLEYWNILLHIPHPYFQNIEILTWYLLATIKLITYSILIQVVSSVHDLNEISFHRVENEISFLDKFVSKTYDYIET